MKKIALAMLLVLIATSVASGQGSPNHNGPRAQDNTPASQPANNTPQQSSASDLYRGFGLTGEDLDREEMSLDPGFGQAGGSKWYGWIHAGAGYYDRVSRGRVGEGHGPNANLNIGSEWLIGTSDYGGSAGRTLRHYLGFRGGVEWDTFEKRNWEGDNFGGWIALSYTITDSFGLARVARREAEEAGLSEDEWPERDAQFLPRWSLNLNAGVYVRHSFGETIFNSYELIKQNTLGPQVEATLTLHGLFIGTGHATHNTSWGYVTARDGFFKALRFNGWWRGQVHVDDHNDTELRAGRRSRPSKHHALRFRVELGIYTGHFTAGRELFEYGFEAGYSIWGQIMQGELDSRLNDHWGYTHSIRLKAFLRINAHLRFDLEYDLGHNDNSQANEQRIYFGFTVADW